ncbi:MAG: barstar family protein [Chitinophagales bacterium]|nr:barstar family protein [Chitinophagales bacterium]
MDSKRQIIINFEHIKTIEDFYKDLATKLDLPEYFGNNLDALYDSLTGHVQTPILIQFTNLNLQQLVTFEGLIDTFQEIEQEKGDIDFEYYIKLDN